MTRDLVVVQASNWPQQSSPLSTVFDLIKLVDEEQVSDIVLNTPTFLIVSHAAGEADWCVQGLPRAGDGQERRVPGGHLLLPHVALAPAGLRGLRGRVPAGPPLQLQQARALAVPGGLPLPLLRPRGLHYQQRHHHPQPRGPRAVEERVPAQRVRAGEQGVHGHGGGHRDQGLGRHGHDRQLQVRGVCKCLQQLI